MLYGAGHKGVMWKLGSFLAGGGGLIGLLLITSGETGAGMLMFAVYGSLGALLSLPFGLRRVESQPAPARTSSIFESPFVFLVPVPLFLAVFLWVFLIVFRTIIWLGDLILTTIWRLVPLDRRARVPPV